MCVSVQYVLLRFYCMPDNKESLIFVIIKIDNALVLFYSIFTSVCYKVTKDGFCT